MLSIRHHVTRLHAVRENYCEDEWCFICDELPVLRQQLQSRDLVKIKVNKGLFEREQRSEVWNYLAENTGSTLVLQRGNIGVLWRR